MYKILAKYAPIFFFGISKYMPDAERKNIKNIMIFCIITIGNILLKRKITISSGREGVGHHSLSPKMRLLIDRFGVNTISKVRMNP